MRSSKRWVYSAWIILTIALAGYLSAEMLIAEDKSLFLIGETSHGHYQIELACDSCHVEGFNDQNDIQNACLDCHSEELEIAQDSHPKSKFTDPRNVEYIEKLDARYCVSCHKEHVPEHTHVMGVTLPEDYCFYCHQTIAEDRPSHTDLAYDSCASAGCHNFHDNRGLYEDFLLKHIAEPNLLTKALLPARNSQEVYRSTNPQAKNLIAADMNAPASIQYDDVIISEWTQSSHAHNGINCMDCHSDRQSEGQAIWLDKPDYNNCKECHEAQLKGFLSGRHGMRLKVGLLPMTPGQARQPMKANSSEKALGCNSCHKAHKDNTQYAAVEACLNCHDDEHSLTYKKSIHFHLWKDEISGRVEKGSGVSCASCHMPRESHKDDGILLVHVQHNQNDNLRPNEKMLRSVCLNCHGLEFSIDALADPLLVKTNYSGLPAQHIPSLDMAMQRLEQSNEKQ